MLVSGGSALKFTSLARVHLLLVVAYERTGRRAEAEALHLRGELPAQDGVWSANALAFDGPGAGPAVRPTGQAAARGAARRSLHESAVHRVEGTERPLRSQAPWQRAELALQGRSQSSVALLQAFWRRAELPADEQAAVKALEQHWRELAVEASAILAAGATVQTEEHLSARPNHWHKFDLWKRGKAVEGRCSLAPTTCRVLEPHTAVLSPMGQASRASRHHTRRLSSHCCTADR